MAVAGHIKATYYVEATDTLQAAHDLAYGQSIGNPYIRTVYDSKLEKYIPEYKAEGRTVTVLFPRRNFSKRDGINYLMSVLMGGQMDIGLIKACILADLELGTYEKSFPRPRFGVAGIKKLLGVQGRPLFGGIVKPKIGLSVAQLVEVVKEMADGGCDFIKEDEILGNPPLCPFKKRVEAVVKAIKGYKVLYAPCITGDGSEIWKKARMAKDLGAGAVHLNIWCGFGAYREIRERVDLPLFFQKSGDRLWTTGPFSIAPKVLYKIVNLIGCDFAHVGMFGGYLSESVGSLREKIYSMGVTTPSFSCGAHPGLVGKLRYLFGDDIMITSGGAIHGHPLGIHAGVRAFHQALKGYDNPPAELKRAIELWGVVK